MSPTGFTLLREPLADLLESLDRLLLLACRFAGVANLQKSPRGRTRGTADDLGVERHRLLVLLQPSVTHRHLAVVARKVGALAKETNGLLVLPPVPVGGGDVPEPRLGVLEIGLEQFLINGDRLVVLADSTVGPGDGRVPLVGILRIQCHVAAVGHHARFDLLLGVIRFGDSTVPVDPVLEPAVTGPRVDVTSLAPVKTGKSPEQVVVGAKDLLDLGVGRLELLVPSRGLIQIGDPVEVLTRGGLLLVGHPLRWNLLTNPGHSPIGQPEPASLLLLVTA